MSTKSLSHKKNSGIKGMILRLSIIPALVIGVLLMMVSSGVSFNLILSQYSEEGSALAAAYATSVENLVDDLCDDLSIVEKDSDTVNESLSLDDRKTVLNRDANMGKFKDFSISYADGKTYNDTDISARDYFKYAMENKSYYVSSPVFRMTDNSLTIMMGKYFSANGQDYLAYGGLDVDTFNKIIEKVHFGDGGICYILDKDGMIIASSDSSAAPVMTVVKDCEDKLYSGLASFADAMIAGESGTERVAFGSDRYVFCYEPISGSEGWSIAVGTSTAPLRNSIITVSLIFITILVVCSITVVFVVISRTRKLCKPITACSERLTSLAQGDIDTPAPECSENNEIRDMSDALASTVETLSGYIGDIKRVLSAIAHGDLTVNPAAEYLGNFSEIKDALTLIAQSLRSTMAEVSRSSVEVREGAAQLSEGATSLSQNAITQASAVDEITSTIIDINKKIEENNRDIERALQSTRTTNEQAQDGMSCMNDLLQAIREIENRSQEIENIIKVIDDIAFQTNILALNAAIEAARAGDAGKGFAVVADEVRNLASKSSEAAQQTGELINKTIEAVARGTELANTASSALSDIVTSVEEVSGVMTNISAASEQQAAAAGQISSGMENVNSTIHDTSATAEESAAASEELSALAVTLSDTVARFRYE